MSAHADEHTSENQGEFRYKDVIFVHVIFQWSVSRAFLRKKILVRFKAHMYDLAAPLILYNGEIDDLDLKPSKLPGINESGCPC